MKKVFFICYLLTVTCYLYSQTAAELDSLLQQESVTIATAARFILGAAELLPPNLNGAAAATVAYNMALEKGWTRKNAGDKATLKDTAFLLMNAFNLKGGIMYSIFKNPRYAYREMVYQRLIQGRAYSSMQLSGQRLLHIIGRTLNEVEGRSEQ